MFSFLQPLFGTIEKLQGTAENLLGKDWGPQRLRRQVFEKKADHRGLERALAQASLSGSKPLFLSIHSWFDSGFLFTQIPTSKKFVCEGTFSAGTILPLDSHLSPQEFDFPDMAPGDVHVMSGESVLSRMGLQDPIVHTETRAFLFAVEPHVRWILMTDCPEVFCKAKVLSLQQAFRKKAKVK